MQTNLLRNKIDVIEIDIKDEYSEEALLYFDQLSPLPDEDVLDQLAAFIDGLVEDGIYAKIDEMWMFAMNDESNAVKGMKGYKECSLVNAPAFEIYKGFTGSGYDSSPYNYIDTNYNPFTDGINWSVLQSGSLGVYNRVDFTSSQVGRTEIGCESGAASQAHIRLKDTSSNTRLTINGTESGLSGSNGGDTIKFRITTRVDSVNTLRYYRAGVQLITSSSGPSNIPNQNVYILCMNANGTPNRYSAAQISFAFVGGNLTADEVLSFNTRLEYFLEYIGASVPGGGATLTIPSGTQKFISTNTPVQILNRYYGHKPLIKSVNDIPAEIKEKDTVTRRLKVQMIDSLDLIDADTSLNMASYWRMFIAKRKNYRGKIIRYYRRIGEGELELRFVGKIDKISIDTKGNATIEAIDLMKAMSKQEYPFISALTLAEDLPAVYTISSAGEETTLEDAVEGDYAKQTRKSMAWQGWSLTGLGGSIPPGTYYFWVIAINSYGEMVDQSTVLTINTHIAYSTIQIRWENSAPSGVETIYYRILGYTQDFTNILNEQYAPDNVFDWNGSTSGSTTPPNPDDIYRYIQLQPAGVYSDPNDWDYVFPSPEPFEVDVEGDISLLNNSGYVQIDEEIISYEQILSDSDGYTLYGLSRTLFGTEAQKHLEGTTLSYIIAQSDPIDIFDMMIYIMQLAGIDDAYIGDSFTTYAALNILDVTCEPLIDGVKNLAQIFFDLVNLADAMAYQDEDGTIQAKLHSDGPEEEITLTDEANLIYGTVSLDLNDDSRFTRWVLYWNRFDLTANIDEPDGYGRGNITIDDDSEEYYEDVNIDKQFTVFLNGEEDSEISAANIYANELLNQRRIRTREAQNFLIASLEIKDDHIKLGQIVYIRTRNVLDEDGSIQTYTYRVIKKEPSGGRIKFVFIRITKDQTEDS